jgi:predicted RNA-binding protein (virulence factor B family)
MRLPANGGPTKKMVRLGEYHELKVLREAPMGLILDDGENGLLLPKREVPRKAKIGDTLKVFVYNDSEDRPIATTLHPAATVGEFAAMRCVSSASFGAFMDWGLPKDILVPHSEQKERMFEGEVYIVRVLLDEVSNRVIGTTRLFKYLKKGAGDLQEGQPVSLLVTAVDRGGVRAIIDGTYEGMLFPDEVHDRMKIGDRKRGYIKKIREDGKVALSLQPQGYRAAMETAPLILKKLEEAGGFLPFGDTTPPEDIRRVFGLSKGSFKKAIGSLYREGLIRIEPNGIRMVS